MAKSILVIGGAGFIGSHFVDLALAHGSRVRVLDCLTYAGRRENVAPSAEFFEVDIRNGDSVLPHLRGFRPDWVVNFAAESHVDRSIETPDVFVETNVVGVLHLLRAALADWRERKSAGYRFLQVSTDEVFGDLGAEEPPFGESHPYRPRSPYSASKAAADHLVQAWWHTYGLPTLVTYCCNNYGSRQMPEKLIPHMVQRAVRELPLPLYGNGLNVREWIHVSDHCRGIWAALERGREGEAYAFGSSEEYSNLELLRKVCGILDELRPRSIGKYFDLVEFVEDRPGHDRRYAIDSSKARKELSYQPQVSLEKGLRDTILSYLATPVQAVDLNRRGLR
jgi:dTDP-glucose 4,6-dehydratase